MLASHRTKLQYIGHGNLTKLLARPLRRPKSARDFFRRKLSCCFLSLILNLPFTILVVSLFIVSETMGKRSDNVKDKATGSPSKKQKGNKQPSSSTEQKKEDQILFHVLAHHEEGDNNISFKELALDIGCHKSNNAWNRIWVSAKEKYLEQSSSGKGHQISSTGLDRVASDEYKENTKHLVVVRKTTEDHQEIIKNGLCAKNKKYSVQIFDVLQEYGPLNRYELAAIIGTSDRSYGFSYGLQELWKTKGYVEKDDLDGKGNKFRLSNKAFLKPEDRPEAKPLTPEMMAKIEHAAQKKPKPKKASEKAKTEIVQEWTYIVGNDG